MRVAYFDCFAGASGDMILGALLDAGLSLDSLTTELSKLPLSGYRISAQGAKRGTVAGTRFTVAVDEPRSHSLDEILNIIGESTLSQRTKEQGSAIFKRLAQAEARAHRLPLGEVHLHELGEIDTIVDIMGAVIGFELLGIERLFSSPLPSGSGAVATEQGVLPVPAPATLELIAISGAPIRPSPPEAELITPTGAAIITTLASFERPTIRLERVGCGIGARHLESIPNVLRLWIGEDVTSEEKGSLILLETNIDDMSPELYGYVLERLFERGALDVWFTPIQMKKNRPAVMLSVLAPRGLEGTMVETILTETSTMGIRIRPIERHESERRVIEFQSSLGPVTLKIKRLYGKGLAISPEFEDCRRLALKHSLPLQRVYQIVQAEANARLS